MRGLIADNNIEGYFERLIDRLDSEPYRELWSLLGLSIETFESLGLDREIVDSVLWHTCQREQLILVTSNRNAEGPDSLEETIRSSNTPQSLPVFTLANPRKILDDRAYANRVVIGLLEHLFEIDRYRGAGRIYLP